MRNTAKSLWLSVALSSLFTTPTEGQVVRQDYLRPERTKVSAIAPASYSEPEPAPAPTEAAPPNRERRPKPKQVPVRQAAHRATMPSEMVMEGPGPDVEAFEMNPSGMHPGDMSYGDDFGSGCAESCCVPCGPDPCWTIWENLQVFGGVDGFKSPVDQGLNGNFGFHEGLNWGGPLFEYGGIGGQIGAQAVQSNLAESYNFEDNRIQFFLTTGLFHRPFDSDGWQGGVVFDWLHDDFYVQMDVAQLRAEISWLSCGHHEIGAWVAIGTTSDTQEVEFDDEQVEDLTWEPIHMYSLFYRTHFGCGGSGRFSAGFTVEGEGLLGGDVLAPLTQHCALMAGANYIIGRNDPAPEESLSEAWGLTISLVWFPGYNSPCSPKNAYRPLFDVANNNWMMLKQGGVHND